MRLAFILPLALAAACGRDSSSRSEASTQESVEFTGSAAAPPPAPAIVADRGTMASFQAHGAAADAATAPAPAPQDPLPFPGPGRATSMLIRTGSASVEVRDVEAAITRVRQLAASAGGYVANTNVQTGREQTPSATLELKIPAERFDQAVNGLEPLGKVEAVNVDAQDVGEEFVDIAARVSNLKRLEERLVSLLAARAGRLEDVLAVERELARIRSEIERYEARLRYLESRAAMSTLVVTVHEPHPVLGAPRSPIGEAFRDAWRNFVGFIAWLIAALGILVPVGAIAVAAGWGMRGAVRRYRAAGGAT